MKNLKFQQSPGGTPLHGLDFECAHTRGAKTQDERPLDDFLCLSIARGATDHHVSGSLTSETSIFRRAQADHSKSLASYFEKSFKILLRL